MTPGSQSRYLVYVEMPAMRLTPPTSSILGVVATSTMASRSSGTAANGTRPHHMPHACASMDSVSTSPTPNTRSSAVMPASARFPSVSVSAGRVLATGPAGADILRTLKPPSVSWRLMRSSSSGPTPSPTT
ncbi:MAG: hypothetical protein LKF00_06665 [Olsenella sp.]|nr:hypothetical protein [Olsenella sp.]